MTAITIDRSTVERLRAANGPVQLRDDHGAIVGEFRPAVDRSAYVGLQSPLSEEELRRREQETGGLSTEEVLRHLRAL